MRASIRAESPGPLRRDVRLKRNASIAPLTDGHIARGPGVTGVPILRGIDDLEMVGIARQAGWCVSRNQCLYITRVRVASVDILGSDSYPTRLASISLILNVTNASHHCSSLMSRM